MYRFEALKIAKFNISLTQFLIMLQGLSHLKASLSASLLRKILLSLDIMPSTLKINGVKATFFMTSLGLFSPLFVSAAFQHILWIPVAVRLCLSVRDTYIKRGSFLRAPDTSYEKIGS